jgi:2-polyprenyl-3-methyl-5-hydroxy-6-metoxy-1,4-benzoquinol methylase
MGLKWQIAQWLELRWWKNYLHGKDKTTYLQWKQNYWLKVLEQLTHVVSIHPHHTICDLGCGPAGIFIALPQNKVTGVDPLIKEYEQHTPFFSRQDYPNVNFVQSTMEEFSSAEKFDAVFCLNAINHVSSIERAFDVLCALPKQGSPVVLSIDAHNHSFFKWLFRLIPGDALHPHQYDLNEYKDFLEKRGLKAEKPIQLKQEFFFTHYVLVAKRNNQ